jgi:FkbM family methyltransferase
MNPRLRYPVLRQIVRQGATLSAFKLLLLAAHFSRKRYRGLCRIALKSFTTNGEISISYKNYNVKRRVSIRVRDLQSDFCSVRELGVDDCYRLPLGFQPDVVLDGGGNIGLFTLMAEALYPRAKFVICEPVPDNLAQIARHFAENHITQTDILPICLGGTPRDMEFYIREANEGSFDPQLPYREIVKVRVLTIDDVLTRYQHRSALIKLDIEGMELEALQAFVRPTDRYYYVVGELHNHKLNKKNLSGLFEKADWIVRYYDETAPGSIFHAYPANALMRENLVKLPSKVDQG